MKQTLSLTLIISLIMLSGYVLYEPQLVKGVTDDVTVSLTVTSEINLACDSTAALTPNIPGQSGGTATGTFNCTTETNDPDGYNLNIKKSQLLLTGAGGSDRQFSDISTATTTWNYPAPGAGAETFGFAVNSAASTTDIVAALLDNGTSACGTGSSVTPWRCWRGIPTTTATTSVAVRSTATPAGGIVIGFGLQAQAGSSNNLQNGDYYTTTTLTAVAN